MTLTSEQISAYRTDGVTCLRGALDSAWLARAQSAWQWSRDHPGPLASGLLPESSGAFQDLCNPESAGPYADLVTHSPLADVAAQLWGQSPVWYMYEQVFHKVGGDVGPTPWHQDTSYLAVDGDHLIAFWISFEPIPRECALEFVVGSHRGTLFNTSRFDPSDPTLPIFPSNELPPLPDIGGNREAFDIVGFSTEPGDVIAFHTSMLHGGGPVSAQTPERRTLTLRFFGPDASSAARPGPAGPYFQDIRHLQPGDPFRHSRFPQVR